MSDFIVGLTGGIGSGKSTVAEIFVELGAALVDTDAIAHELTAANGAAMPAIIAAFGAEVLTPDGALDRVVMRQRVFAEPEARLRLEGILHPMIRQLAATRCREAIAPYVILAVPLLVEAGNYRERCDRIVVVDCPENSQVERVMARNGLDENVVRNILAAQASREERLAIADDVIRNDGSLAQLRDSVTLLHFKYMSFFVEKSNANG